MAELIQFRGRDGNHHRNEGCHRSDVNLFTDGCKSPIIIRREHEVAVSISFHKGYFTTPFVEKVLQELAYSGEWELFIPDERDTLIQCYASFFVILNKKYGKDTAKVLNTIVDQIVSNVYLEEIRVLSHKVSIDELTKPYRYYGFINAKTKVALSLVGVHTAQDIAEMTREELCRIPGVTTEEIVRLERGLAARGIYLTNNIPELI
ncbi:helix-hairpin-helix domain-containing protein [Candidatus Saccharibacteria bacterium]|nr:helix-hairpin-helix domain-containing protein [Candidatus Saccharibacteria bacterium]